MSDKEIARRIAQTFLHSHSNSLTKYKRFHFPLRAYRVTGDTNFVPYVAHAFSQLEPRWRDDITGVFDATYVSGRTARILARYEQGASCFNRARYAAVSKHGEFLFYKSVLLKLATLEFLGLTNAPWSAPAQSAIAEMRSIDFTPFVLSTNAIRYKAAQVVNLVYYLHDLGLADLRKELFEKIRETFPAHLDSSLTRREFAMKAYAMTHIIICESRYYQRFVTTEDFAWILSWFECNRDRIMRETTPDLIGEVGVCFILARQPEHAIVEETRQIIRRCFDEKRGYLPRRGDNETLKRAEHRNAVAFILLTAPRTLHPGPDIANR